MRNAMRNVLFDLLFSPATFWLSHKNLPEKIKLPFLLTFNSPSRTLPRPCIGMRTLTSHRQSAAMPKPSITSDIHQHLDICRDLTSKVTFNLVFPLNFLVDLPNLVRRKLMDTFAPINVSRIQDFLSGCPADSVNVGQADLYPFVFW
jgi:hypothetical protein